MTEVLPQVTAKTIRERPVQNALQAMQGKAAGSMADVNPNDIESMEILKDASATAIYGSRGANGVVLISTKKGKTGKVTINYDGSVSFSKMDSMTDWMNSGELIDRNRQSNINAGAYTGKYGNAPDPDIDGNGMGMFEPHYTLKPFTQSMLDLLTDENGNPLDDSAKKAYQNYGY